MSAKSLKFFGPPTTKWQPSKTGNERKPSFNGQNFQTSQIPDIWFNENTYIFSLLRQNKKYFS